MEKDQKRVLGFCERYRMKTIWKYILKFRQNQEITLKKDAQILSVQLQNEKLCLWALLDTDEVDEMCKIHIIGTGTEIEEKLDYHIGTVQQSVYVWHVFAEVL